MLPVAEGEPETDGEPDADAEPEIDCVGVPVEEPVALGLGVGEADGKLVPTGQCVLSRPRSKPPSAEMTICRSKLGFVETYACARMANTVMPSYCVG